jgi:hypothetical protein
MAFSEKVKLEARRKSNFRCCICEKLFSGEVHHIIPESEGGPDILDNAVLLCPNCHDSYGGNPEKRKQIKQKRDHWWELMEERTRQVISAKDFNYTQIDSVSETINQLTSQPINHAKQSGKKGAAIYHNIFAHEGFEESAKILIELLKRAQQEYPNGKRTLYLDIEGHKNVQEGFDKDMFELQRSFILGFLMPYLSEAHLPLISVKNKKPQNNDIPKEISIFSSEKEAIEFKEKSKEQDIIIFSADKDKFL